MLSRGGKLLLPTRLTVNIKTGMNLSRENYEASAADGEKKKLLIVPGATHGQSVYRDTEAVIGSICSFMEEV